MKVKVNVEFVMLCLFLGALLFGLVAYLHDWHAGDVVKMCGVDARIIEPRPALFEVQLYGCDGTCRWRTTFVTRDRVEAERVCGGAP